MLNFTRHLDLQLRRAQKLPLHEKKKKNSHTFSSAIRLLSVRVQVMFDVNFMLRHSQVVCVCVRAE